MNRAQRKAAGIAKAKGARHLVTGHKELDAKLRKLAVKDANKIVRVATGKGARIILAGQKSEVTPQYKDAKKALGMKVKSKPTGCEAKVGAAVGKKLAESDRKGSLGITPQTIYFFILGSRLRKRTKIGGFLGATGGNLTTGSMPAVLSNVIKGGFRKSESGAMKRIRSEIWSGIERSVAK